MLKIGKAAILVNMGFIHKGYLGYERADTLFTEIKVEKITEGCDGNIWINENMRVKHVFPNINEAKKFVNNYLKKEILEKKKENLRIALLINYYEQIMMEND